jgi:hypothetical protein
MHARLYCVLTARCKIPCNRNEQIQTVNMHVHTYIQVQDLKDQLEKMQMKMADMVPRSEVLDRDKASVSVQMHLCLLCAYTYICHAIVRACARWQTLKK